MAKLSIHIVTFNSRQFIKYCLDSLFKSDFNDYQVFVIDNNSCDGGLDFIKENYLKEKKDKKLFLIQNKENKGFTGAHNQALNLTDSEFVLVLNPDTILESDFLTKMVGFMEKEKKVAAATGKMLKARLKDFELEQVEKTNLIDTTGLKALKSGRVLDRGEGEEDRDQYKSGQVFGVSGACAFYKRKALEEVKMKNGNSCEYFDEDFFAYKEDIDLSWRLRLFGWKVKYFSNAKSYHFRAGSSLKNRFKKPALIQKWSYRNNLWMLLKNSLFLCFMSRIFHVLWYEFCKKIYFLITRPILFFKTIISLLKKIKKMLKKRKYIMKNKKIDIDDICSWFNN